MKKIFAMLLTLAIVFSFASCIRFGGADCTDHVDSDKDGKCDVCGEEYTPACTSHTDADANGKCDTCGADVAPCTSHTDADANGKCDICGADVVVEAGVMTYAEFAAAELNSEVTVITYVQAKQGWWNNEGVDVASFYTQAPDGAYFLYDMPCTEAEYAALVPGTCIKVTGTKIEWSGEVEIGDATFEILTDKAPYVATAIDLTDEIAAGEDISAHPNKLIAIEDAIVAEAPLYKWNGTGSAGDDIYLTLNVGDERITVVVESYLHGDGSEVYETFEALEVGEVISIEAFLYWYNGAQPHVNSVVKTGDVMSYDEFVAAALNSEVTVVTYVQAKQGWWNNEGIDVATFYTQASDGAYFLYNMPCTEAEYAALVPGTCIKVTGTKIAWSGEVEIEDATFEIITGKAPYIAEAVNVVDKIAAEEDLSAMQNQLIALDATVTAAPIYNWDGSGSAGNDIYLSVSVGDEAFTLVVESYLHGDGSEVYETVEALEVGDYISVEAFLYWYNGAQPHVNSVVKVDGVMSYDEFVAAELNSEVTVVTYVQAKQGWWNNEGVDVATFYTQAHDGAYFLYDMPCTEDEYAALVPGTCIKVTGYKAEWSGEVEIVDAEFEIIPGIAPYVATAIDLTDEIAAGDDISAHQNKLIAVEATVTAAPLYKWDGSGSAGDDIYLSVSVGDEAFTLVVESYLHGDGSEVYEAIEALEVGDEISVEAFLYWYNGAQPHVNAVID